MFSHGQEMKISVPSASEIEAPLGGTTVVYNVSITEGSDNYIVTKTFREFEDLHKKLQRKYQNLSFPSLAKVSPDSNSRCKAADQFLTFVAAHCEIISVNLIKQFLGIDSEANYQIATTNPDPDPEIEEPEPLFKTVTPKKQVPKPINPPPQDKDDLTHEFAASDKILNQQHGKTSFFDYEEEDDDDDDLFKVTTKPKPEPQKQESDLKPKKPAAVELFGSENLTSSIRDSNKEVNENKVIIPNKEEEILESKFDESELDESILNIEDDLDDLKNLSLTPKRVPVPKQESGVADQQPKIKSKPIPPPKKPSLMKKPPLAPKPGTPKPSSDVTKNLDQLDINSYINAEEMANQQEAKLFD